MDSVCKRLLQRYALESGPRVAQPHTNLQVHLLQCDATTGLRNGLCLPLVRPLRTWPLTSDCPKEKPGMISAMMYVCNVSCATGMVGTSAGF